MLNQIFLGATGTLFGILSMITKSDTPFIVACIFWTGFMVLEGIGGDHKKKL